jgi:D-inositol-3-phosphate glycosyltransferase
MNGRIATLMVHTSPLDQAGVGDAGGMNVYVAENARRMAAMGVKIDIFTRRNHAELPDVVELAEGVNVRHLDAGPIEGLSKEDLPGFIGQLSSEFSDVLKTTPIYDVIHSHYWISGMVGIPASQRFGIPLVQTMHTMAKVKNLNLAEGELAEPELRAEGETAVVRASSALIANTDSEAASLVSLYGACPDLVHVVTPGVDLYTFTPGSGKSAARVALGIPSDATVITFVGRIQPHKGPELLIRATAEMLSHSPHLRQKLVVYVIGGDSGTGSTEVARLKELANWLNLSGVIRFLDPIPRMELPNWYRSADLVCVPSYSESFGLVALEAQACGTPVVAAAVGGLRTAVADGISGVLVDGHDARAWSSVLARLISEPARRVLLSLGAIEHSSHFGWDATARGTLDIYDRVLSLAQHQKSSSQR